MAHENFFAGKTVLIIDDSNMIREGLIVLYQSLGMRVVGATGDGFEGLELYKKTKPNLVSLDIIMPSMHGIECYRHLKQLNAEQDIVFLSCISHENIVKETFKDEIQAECFQSKPSSTEQLTNALTQFYKLDLEATITTAENHNDAEDLNHDTAEIIIDKAANH